MTQASNARPAGQVFNLVLIKPTHYDDDGYPIQWFRSAIPSNTLACINGLAEDAARRQVLGPDVEIRIHAFDETNTRVRPAKIIETFRQSGGLGMICFVGVQSNQFPRALDLARRFRAHKAQVAIGGGFYALIVAVFDIAGLRTTLVAKAGPIWLRLIKKVDAQAS